MMTGRGPGAGLDPGLGAGLDPGLGAGPDPGLGPGLDPGLGPGLDPLLTISTLSMLISPAQFCPRTPTIWMTGFVPA